MMRSRFDEQLDQLNKELLEMGALIEHAIESASQALISQDVVSAKKAIEFDREVDQKEKDIESLCLRLLLQQQPVARDLRQISAALKMITDMERIGDQALDIAETAGFMGPLDEADAGLFKSLAQIVVAMVTDSVDAYVSRDPDAARAVAKRDDEADDVFKAIKSAMIERLSRRPGDGEYALDLLMIAKYLERIGDHATNIAEWVEFAATGLYKGREML
jgi:phosphate transport system protein